jgi:hypothetical protein
MFPDSCLVRGEHHLIKVAAYHSHINTIISDFLAVIDFGRPISDRRLRSFYYIKMYFKFEPSHFYLTAEIQNHVKLRAKSTVENPDP